MLAIVGSVVLSGTKVEPCCFNSLNFWQQVLNIGERKMLDETRISAHHNSKLKNSYLDIYGLLRSIRSNDRHIDSRFYFDLINSNPEYPIWLKRQMVKLIRRRIKRIGDKSIERKWFEFRLIVPRQRLSWVDSCAVPTGYYVKHLFFDSKNIFITLGRQSKNDKPLIYDPLKLKSYERNSWSHSAPFPSKSHKLSKCRNGIKKNMISNS